MIILFQGSENREVQARFYLERHITRKWIERGFGIENAALGKNC